MLLNWHFENYRLGLNNYEVKNFRRLLDQIIKGFSDNSFDLSNEKVNIEVNMFIVYCICSLLSQSLHKLITNSSYINYAIIDRVLTYSSLIFDKEDSISIIEKIFGSYKIDKYGTEILYLMLLYSSKPLKKTEVLELIKRRLSPYISN